MFNTIDMMDFLFFSKISSEYFFHNKTMFKDISFSSMRVISLKFKDVTLCGSDFAIFVVSFAYRFFNCIRTWYTFIPSFMSFLELGFWRQMFAFFHFAHFKQSFFGMIFSIKRMVFRIFKSFFCNITQFSFCFFRVRFCSFVNALRHKYLQIKKATNRCAKENRNVFYPASRVILNKKNLFSSAQTNYITEGELSQ
ncbi:hypothetical protein LCGC14_1496260 [marine sediment metagenome]|uniref:Uncharacterized protein n=1 Tax=marine sediment metagenome TaxID=412755 RepID=A0A0F9J5Y5_9ZZZZ